MKEIVIKIDKQFIEESVYQEDWGDVNLDSKEVSERISEYIKVSSETIVRNAISEVASEIIKKELKKELKEKVKAFIIGMADTELFYRDEFRELLVGIARDNKKEIDKKVKVFLESNNNDGQLISAIGHDMNSRFFNAIVDGKIE